VDRRGLPPASTASSRWSRPWPGSRRRYRLRRRPGSRASASGRFAPASAIVHFDGPLSGPAVLSARWRLLDERGKVLALHAARLQEPITAPTHAGLVAAQGRLVTALSRDIAAEIRRHPR
jgi:uncharacterized lipoprotein YmbA